MVIAEVLRTASKGQAVSTDPPETLVRFARPHYLIGTVWVVRFIVGFGPIRRFLTGTLSLPSDDSRLLEQEGLYFLLLPAFLCASAWAATYLQTTAVYHFLRLLSYAGRLLSCIPGSVSSQAKTVQVLLSVAAILMTSLCGTLGLLLSAGLLILKVLRLLYVTGRRLDSRETHSSLGLLFPAMLIVNLQALLSIAPLVMWLKAGIGAGSPLSPLNPDPSRLTGLLTSASVGILLFFESHVSSRSSDCVGSWCLYILAVISVLYASLSLYRLPAVVSIAMTIISLPRLFSGLSRLTGASHAESKKE
ncbi:GPI inositol-deacylase [Plakobranchus ocellatus]|uniref:GPI inositol-deacylase n=1 Tax=Plakobranchus ocellatus TaxID=259542 RepID=A0AAV4A518_9GAST|nr:GPI inositol-deacylase [Plakobranchus ocellatus]